MTGHESEEEQQVEPQHVVLQEKGKHEHKVKASQEAGDSTSTPVRLGVRESPKTQAKDCECLRDGMRINRVMPGHDLAKQATLFVDLPVQLEGVDQLAVSRQVEDKYVLRLISNCIHVTYQTGGVGVLFKHVATQDVVVDYQAGEANIAQTNAPFLVWFTAATVVSMV